VPSHIVSVVLYGLTYLSSFKESFRWISIIVDVFSSVYSRFRNYHNTDVIFHFLQCHIILVSDEKNVKVKKVEPFADCFQPFLSLSQYTDTPTAGTTSSTHQLLLTPLV